MPEWLARIATAFGLGPARTVCRADLTADRPGHDGTFRDLSDRIAAFAATRQSRFLFLSALADGTLYEDKIHLWASGLKEEFALSPSPKPLYNPFGRLREFWGTHLYSGTLDPSGGDGKARPSSVPIEADNPALRRPIARVLRTSEWDRRQYTYGLTGAGLGEVGLFSVNDLANDRAYVLPVGPEKITIYEADELGKGTFYRYEEWRDDPRADYEEDADGNLYVPDRVIYREEGEVMSLRGRPALCEFRTYLVDGTQAVAYAWPGNPESWRWAEPYPFLPLTLVPHVQPHPGCPYGESEAMGIVAKILEIDDVATLIDEAIRKYVDPVWLFSGVRSDQQIEASRGRDRLPALFSGDPGSKAQALLAAINFADMSGVLDRFKAEILDDKPELQKPIANASGDASGKALRIYRQGVETKGQTRRANYDAALAEQVTNCLRINGIMGRPGFEDFTPEKVAARPESLDWRIGERGLFKKDPLDVLDERKEFWANAESADRAGVPIRVYLRREGWSDAEIAEVTAAQDDAIARGLSVGRSKQAAPPTDAAALAIQSPGGSAP
jgi:hypothetical protein